MGKVNTAAGPVAAEDLGMTLMHEHVTLRLTGAESDTLTPGPSRREVMAASLDWVAKMQDRGVKTIVDPAPGDMGRDLELSAELASRTGLNIVCATGLFNEEMGGKAYWHHKRRVLQNMGKIGDFHRYLADVFVNEIENGVNGVRCGIIKVASQSGEITDYEKDVLVAAAIACKETDCPISTHSDDGYLGAKQQAFLVGQGVPAHRIVIGHSCNVGDHGYHRHVVEHGSYIGFDRFGFERINSDEVRMEALIRLLRTGAGESIVISNDACFCWAQNEAPDSLRANREAERGASWTPLRVNDYIVPELRRRGVTGAELDLLLVRNPRRYLSRGAPPAKVSTPALDTASSAN